MLAAEKSIAVPEFMERLSDARRRSDELFSLVRPESLYERPIAERHRIIFYVGHLEAFDWNLLNQALPGSKKSIHPEYDRLFAFGIDPVDGGLPSDVPSDWPSLEAVRSYVANIRGALDQRVADAILQLNSPVRDGFLLRTLLNVAVEHRLMHVETLAYMLHHLPISMKQRPEASHRASLRVVTSDGARPAVVPSAIAIPAGEVTLGLSRTGQNATHFGWDNEYEAHTVNVPAFEIDQYKVSNQQYLEFVNGGGYDSRAFWSDDDWKWKTSSEISHPLFWKKDGNAWRWRTMFDEVALPSDWPVYVSQAEASAYSRWAGKSLPTEAEWQRAAYGGADSNANLNSNVSRKAGNFDFQRWDPVPVNEFPEDQSALGVHGIIGNGWEWTSTVFGPFPGFEPFPFYRGYSADFFDGKHFVIKGGSARTAACMVRPTFRNWFQAHYQYVYAGFRCVRRR
jgi:gamma-glutamyl hercynylcysteine S-oxide synthase